MTLYKEHAPTDARASLFPAVVAALGRWPLRLCRLGWLGGKADVL